MKGELEHVEIPGEHEARGRTWEVVRAAYLERERISWPRRHAREVALSAAAVAVVAAAVTPAGRSVVGSIRDAVGRQQVGVRNASPELLRLPAPGRLLVQSRRGVWVVQRDGSRRLLGRYRDASWSPRGLFVAAVRDRHELVALDPKGNVRWIKPHARVIRSPRWSYDGFRIAYFASSALRVINGDGTGDHAIAAANPKAPPVWRPQAHQLAYSVGGRVRIVDVDRATRLRAGAADRARLNSFPPGGAVVTRLVMTCAGITGRVCTAANPGRSILIVGGRQVFSGAGRFSSVASSPDGRWLAIGWPTADQFVFVRVRGEPRLVAVSNVARQFGSSPSIAGWAR